MITGFSSDSAPTFCAQRGLRLIGCSMNAIELSQSRARRGSPHALPEFEHALDVVVLLVAVERRLVVAFDSVEHGCDPRQPVHVRSDVAGDLELEPAVAVDPHDVFQRLGQTVAYPAAHVGLRA